MTTNRRLWLKQMGLGLAGMGLAHIPSLASPAPADRLWGSAGDNDRPIILRSNENPYGPSPLARKAFAGNLQISNRYNWEIATQLIAAIAAKHRVKEKQVLLGAGSTELLDLVAKLASLYKGNYVIADPSYDYWTVTLDNLGLKKKTIPLTPGKQTNLQAMREAVDKDTRLVHLCNPNNPTGTICDGKELAAFVGSIPSTTLILVDEAYLDFTAQPSLCLLVDAHPNLVIAKTFSKIYGLAGARIGYAIAHSSLISQLAGMQSNTNNSVSVLSKLAAIASLQDDRFIADCYSLNETTRAYTIAGLQQLDCTCIPSHTNFIYFSLANYTRDYFRQLENNRIQGTRIYEENGQWTRITVGKMDEMKKFIAALQ